MTRDEVIARIRKHADAIRAEGATALWLFGSTARDEAGPDSDIDVMVELVDEASILDMIGVKHIIEDEIGRKVDIGEAHMLRPQLRAAVLAEAVRVL